MNIALWILQALLALHTLAGAFWKFKNTTEAVPSLKALPQVVWLGLGGVEILCAIGLVLPAILKNAGILTPLAAAVIALEMLLFCVLHLMSGDQNHGQMVYWMVVTAFCAFIVYGRSVLAPF